MPLDWSHDQLKQEVMKLPKTQQYLQDREPRKVIVVPGKIVNFVV